MFASLSILPKRKESLSVPWSPGKNNLQGSSFHCSRTSRPASCLGKSRTSTGSQHHCHERRRPFKLLPHLLFPNTNSPAYIHLSKIQLDRFYARVFDKAPQQHTTHNTTPPSWLPTRSSTTRPCRITSDMSRQSVRLLIPPMPQSTTSSASLFS
jgi:hypothetical protein